MAGCVNSCDACFVFDLTYCTLMQSSSHEGWLIDECKLVIIVYLSLNDY